MVVPYRGNRVHLLWCCSMHNGPPFRGRVPMPIIIVFIFDAAELYTRSTNKHNLKTCASSRRPRADRGSKRFRLCGTRNAFAATSSAIYWSVGVCLSMVFCCVLYSENDYWLRVWILCGNRNKIGYSKFCVLSLAKKGYRTVYANEVVAYGSLSMPFTAVGL